MKLGTRKTSYGITPGPKFRQRFSLGASAFGFAALLALPWATGCKSESGPTVGSQTNWLVSCQSSSDCGDLDCVCGTCTLDCSSERSCGDMEGASCVSMNSAGAVALCGGTASPMDLCALRCEPGTCPAGSSCVAGICAPEVTPSTTVTIDTSRQFQTLLGFGASFQEDAETIFAHPERAALLDAMFDESGFEMLRLKNRFEDGAIGELSTTLALLSEASARIGRSPTVFLYSTTPPAELKANGSRTCEITDVGCTLARTPEGDFDYAGFAEYWRASLAAYEEAGILPTFVSIQSDADWLPSEYPAEACRLWPEEGVVDVTLSSGEVVQGEFAGYVEALAAVKSALAGQYEPEFAAPEVGSSVMVGPYTDVLDGSDYGALSFHLYGEEPIDGDLQFLEHIAQVSEENDLVGIQSEMQENGLNTAALTHQTLVHGGASAYLQRNFITTDLSEDSHGLIGTTSDTFTILPAYHALAHFARHTEEGWKRVATEFDEASVLASAFVAPDESALTIVLINPTDTPAAVQVDVDEAWVRGLAGATVTRTVFNGVERSSELGEISDPGVVQLPGSSILTIALD